MVNIKKVFSILLIVAAIGVSFFSFNLKARISSAASGTKYIYSASDLVTFANQVNTGSGSYYNYNVYLMNNINMSGVSFPGIGINDGNNLSKYHFCGTFYGQNYTIKNLSVSGTQDRGLFNYLDGTVRDLTINGGTINCNNNYSAGAFAGSMYNYAKIYNCINLNCAIKGYINNSAYLGGIVGYLNSSSATIEKCYSNTTVHTTGYDTVRAGGIAGICAGKSTIKECFVNGTVTAGDGNTATSYAGGVVGESKANITNCLNKATVKAYAKVTNYSFTSINPLSSATSGSEYKASGQLDSISSVVPGNTSGSGYTKSTMYAYIGGITGVQTDGTISYCINTSTTDYKSYGGYVYLKYDMYYKLYNFAQLNGNYYTWSYGHYHLYRNYFNSISGYKTGGTISNCYHPGKVTDRFSTWNGTIYYQHNNEAQTSKSFSCSAIGDYENITFIDTKNYTSPQLMVIARRGTGITFTYAPHQKDNKTLYTISRPTNEDDWCLPTTGKTHIQSSTAMSTITDNNTAIWGYDGSTPKIKHFYWADNAVKPS